MNRWKFGLDTLFSSQKAADQFLKNHWPDQPTVHQGKLSRFKALISIPEFQDTRKLVQLFDGKELVPVWPPPTMPKGTKVRMVGSKEALKLHRRGWTLYLNGVERYLPAIRPYLRSLERDFGIGWNLSGCSVFVSPAGTGATKPHFDYDWGFNIQVRGRKIWHFARNTSVTNPTSGGTIGAPVTPEMSIYRDALPSVTPKPDLVVEAKPGAVAFVPRGCWHWTHVKDDSLAIDLVVSPRPWTFIGNALVKRILFTSEMWRTVPFGYQKGGRVKSSSLMTPHQFREELKKMVDQIPDEDFLSELLSLGDFFHLKWKFSLDQKVQFRMKDGKIQATTPDGKMKTLHPHSSGLWPYFENLSGLNKSFTGPEWLEIFYPLSRSRVENITRELMDLDIIRRKSSRSN